MINRTVFDYHEQYIKAELVYRDLKLVLGDYPTWILDYHIGDFGDSYVADLLEMEGLEVLDYDTGKALNLVEWIEADWFDINKLDDSQGTLNDYIDYLDDYINLGESLLRSIDYNVEPIAVLGTSNSTALLIYDIQHGVDDYIVAGFNLTSSNPYKVVYNDDNDYIVINDNIYYVNDMMRV